MSEHALDQKQTRGYLLSEDGQFRLKQLHGHMVFLSQLAQSRTRDEEEDAAPEVSLGELAVCLQLLAEQAAQVLEQASWPARREAERAPSYAAHEAERSEEGAIEDEAPPVAAAEDAAAGEDALDAEANEAVRFVFGVTLDQMDELDRLLRLVTALGDAVFCTAEDGLAEGSLHALGHAIYDDALAVQAIVEQVTAQRLPWARKPPSRVREAPAVYHAGPTPRAVAGAQATVLPLPLAVQQEGRYPLAALRLH